MIRTQLWDWRELLLVVLETARQPQQVNKRNSSSLYMCTMTAAANVLLLRSPSNELSDKYEDAFTKVSYNSHSLPVLETAYVDPEGLKHVLLAGPRNQTEDWKYDGVIATSARACEAWKAAAEALVPENGGGAELSDGGSWKDTTFYVVGNATFTALFETSPKVINSKFIPGADNVKGMEDAGTAEKLAHFILRDLALGDDEGDAQVKVERRMLFLKGDKNRETLPQILEEGGVRLDAVQVYETRGSTTFEADLGEFLEWAKGEGWLEAGAGADADGTGRRKRSWWIVFFAPSAADFVLPFLHDRFALPMLASEDDDAMDAEAENNESDGLLPARLAAIGPTTELFLRETLKLKVDVVAPKPTAQHLSDAVKAWDQAHERVKGGPA